MSQVTRQKRIILATGSRRVDDFAGAYQQIFSWLEFEAHLFGRKEVLVIEGGAEGWDTVYGQAAEDLGVHRRRIDAVRDRVELVKQLMEKYPTKPACWAHARDWDSGTGHCARAAREAGIPTADYGVRTDAESKKEE